MSGIDSVNCNCNSTMMREVGADDLSMRKDRAGLPEAAAAAGCVGLFQVAYFFFFHFLPRLSRAFIERSTFIVHCLNFISSSDFLCLLSSQFFLLSPIGVFLRVSFRSRPALLSFPTFLF